MHPNTLFVQLKYSEVLSDHLHSNSFFVSTFAKSIWA
jgi:hypothetical protein